MVKRTKRKSNKVPKSILIATLDFETDPFKFGREPQPFCAGIFDGESYRNWWDSDPGELVLNVVDYIRDELKGFTLYAHNGGKFDYFFMLEHFEPNIKIINGRIAKAKIGETILTDSLLILPAPLSAHKKDEFDYEKMEKCNRLRHKQEILKYLHNDCIYLYEWVKKFVDLFGKKLTIAGTAYNELKKTGYDPVNTYEDYDSLFRMFYFGGRVQAFKIGQIKGDYEYIDINSAYPYAMLSKHAYGGRYYEIRKPPENYDGYFAVIDAISYGALPHRNIETGKLEFPDSEEIREFFCTGWEIKVGVDTGTLTVIKYKKIYVHEQIKDFKNFVNQFYDGRLQAKKDGNETLAFFLKIILNSCYGKFGQDGRQFKNYCLTGHSEVPENFFNLKDSLDKAWTLYSENHAVNIWEQPAPVHVYNNVATSASITGYVRAYLWQAICDSVEPVYCDTDSIMCKKFNGDKGNKLGEWKLEANLDRIYIGGRKFYACHVKNSVKGNDIKHDGSIEKNSEYKTACKGGVLTPIQIITEIKTGKGFIWEKASPAYSLKYGTRFLSRTINRQF